jgi:hypothetical protein
MGNDPMLRKINFMLLGASIATGLFGTIIIYVYNRPEFFANRNVAFIFAFMAMTASLAGLALVQWDIRRKYLRGLVERLAAAALAGLVFYLEFLVAGLVLGLGKATLSDSLSVGSLLSIGYLLFVPTFAACGCIGLVRIIFDHKNH